MGSPDGLPAGSMSNFRHHVPGGIPTPDDRQPAPSTYMTLRYSLYYTLSATHYHAPTGIRLWDITQSPAPHTHTPSPAHKRQRTDTGGTHSTPGALRATQHDAPDPPASGAAT